MYFEKFQYTLKTNEILLNSQGTATTTGRREEVGPYVFSDLHDVKSRADDNQNISRSTLTSKLIILR